MALQLYTAPATIGVASHIAFEESGLDYEAVRVKVAVKEHQSEQYRQVNPKLRVPSLVIDDQVLTETPAILAYVAQLAPSSPLGLPADPLALAQIHSFNCYLASTVHVAHAHKMRGARWTDNADAQAAMSAYVPVSMSACFELIETRLMKGPWVHGDAFSISDPYLFAICEWLEGDAVDIGQYPVVCAHYLAMQGRDSVKRVLGAFS